jgi:hypothetical protein
VFVECLSMYRADGDRHYACVGEVKFVNGIAAMSASGLYGPTRVAAGIVGGANLLRGAARGGGHARLHGARPRAVSRRAPHHCLGCKCSPLCNVHVGSRRRFNGPPYRKLS